MNANEILNEFAKIVNSIGNKLTLEKAYQNMMDYSKTRCRMTP